MTQYKGLRYVPINKGDWDNTKNTEYESLTVVQYEGTSYTSNKIVPIGIDIKNEIFWTVTGDYNEQVAIYKQAVDN